MSGPRGQTYPRSGKGRSRKSLPKAAFQPESIFSEQSSTFDNLLPPEATYSYGFKPHQIDPDNFTPENRGQYLHFLHQLNEMIWQEEFPPEAIWEIDATRMTSDQVLKIIFCRISSKNVKTDLVIFAVSNMLSTHARIAEEKVCSAEHHDLIRQIRNHFEELLSWVFVK